MFRYYVYIISILCSFSVVSAVGDLKISGAINSTDATGSVLISKNEMSKFERASIITTTPWTESNKKIHFEGVSLMRILKYVGAHGRVLKMHALNDYTVDIPIQDVQRYDILLASSMDGKNLEVKNFGPYFIIYPLDTYKDEINMPKYLSRFIWQVDEITVVK
ncbi:molybdopterin-dependent oxidoreductase [Buttiauxella sp. 3AFRM03]|uniref:molybdopterin-dependent oxidoreductase n=1 Tax=Buttiauxella sp. 3AFRM03 TaxID=2479367 RepID=UPI0013901063|nr:molybdopterin-dependent oxidoreductase [Buttiauxella sp. 3AFRM03]